MTDAAVAGLAQVTGRRAACAAVGCAQAGWYRRHRQSPLPPRPELIPHRDRRQPRALAPAERQAIVDVLHSGRFADAAPAEVWATLLDEGSYLGSVSAFYRVLRERGEVAERRRQATHPPTVKPELMASAPNQVWSWDITKLHGPAKWTYYYLAVIPVALRQGRREDCGVGRHADDVPSGDERLELAAGEQLAGKVVQPHRHALGGQLGKRVMAGVTGYVQAFGCRCSPSRQVRAGRSAVPPVSGAKVAGWPPGREPCRASWMLSRAAAATASAVMPNWRYRVW